MELIERFLKYVSFDTQSSEEGEGCPSTDKQMVFARYLENELKAIGLEEVSLDEHGYLYATLPANTEREVPTIGFIAHIDTSPDYSGKDVKPRIVEQYDGGDIVLCAEEGIVTSPKQFPELSDHVGEDLIVTDGHTLLGADDKAGIAEIMQLLEILITEKIPHGQISVAFTPDEECGSGAAHFDFDTFDAEVAYTLDGDGEGEIQYQNFNACEAKFEINGKNVHPGSAKDVMINAVLIAADINNMLPRFEIPRHTEQYEGFYHLLSIHGDEGHAVSEYIIRDHDSASFEARRNTLRHIEKILNELWGEGTVTLTLTDEYQNMECIIKDHMYLIDYAREACAKANVPEDISPIRGGTDGCKLSFKGLPCPNLGTGGHGYHGPLEHVTIEGMEAAVRVIVELVKIFANE